VLRQAMIEAGRSGWVATEGWRVRKDGTRFLGAGVLCSLEDGNVQKYGVLIRDITVRRPAEDLQQAGKIESSEVLWGRIAHNFSSLLTAVMRSLSFIKIKLPKNDPLYPMVEAAEQSSIRATALVAQLLGDS
jgi:hypothetical protein